MNLQCAGGGFDLQQIGAVHRLAGGHGPLLVALDTTILIDLATHGDALWEGEGPQVDGEYGDELAALRGVLDIWEGRDMRFVVSNGQLNDARRRMSPEQASKRHRQVGSIHAALACTLDLPPVVAERPSLEMISNDGDRDVVANAIAHGCHILLTGDKGLLRHREVMETYRLTPLTPVDLLSELLIAGESAVRGCEHGWIPDLHKLHHFHEASTPE